MKHLNQKESISMLGGKKNRRINQHISRSLFILFIGTWFLFENCGNPVNDEVLLPVRIEKKCGYINTNGQLIIKPQFANAKEFYEDAAAIQGIDESMRASFWGYVDITGKIKVPMIYEAASNFSEGVAAVRNTKGKTGYIDISGKVMIDFIYDFGDIFHEGFALVIIKKRYHVINKNGKILFPVNELPNYNFHYKDGFAIVHRKRSNHIGDNLYAYINTKGKLLTDFSFTEAGDFSDGYAYVALKNGTSKFINEKGNISFPGINYQAISEFSEGYAAVKIKNICGFIDKNGNFKIKASYHNCRSFHDGLAAVYMNGKWGYIDTNGNMIINPQFTEAHDFSNGLAVVQLGKENNWGIINKSGRLIVNPIFPNSYDIDFNREGFKDGVAYVNLPDKPGKHGYVNKEGQFIFKEN